MRHASLVLPRPKASPRALRVTCLLPESGSLLIIAVKFSIWYHFARGPGLCCSSQVHIKNEARAVVLNTVTIQGASTSTFSQASLD